MAFRLPNFNLEVNIWRQGHNPLIADPDLISTCALVYGRRFQVEVTPRSFLPNQFTNAPAAVMTMDMLLPPLTDIRGWEGSTGADTCECPAGSGRYYWVLSVDDIGKGYANEHRVAKISAVLGSWVAPYS